MMIHSGFSVQLRCHLCTLESSHLCTLPVARAVHAACVCGSQLHREHELVAWPPSRCEAFESRCSATGATPLDIPMRSPTGQMCTEEPGHASSASRCPDPSITRVKPRLAADPALLGFRPCEALGRKAFMPPSVGGGCIGIPTPQLAAPVHSFESI